MIEYRSLAVQWKCQSLPYVLPGSFWFAGPPICELVTHGHPACQEGAHTDPLVRNPASSDEAQPPSTAASRLGGKGDSGERR